LSDIFTISDLSIQQAIHTGSSIGPVPKVLLPTPFRLGGTGHFKAKKPCFRSKFRHFLLISPAAPAVSICWLLRGQSRTQMSLIGKDPDSHFDASLAQL
jgi:hypothetical protein